MDSLPSPSHYRGPDQFDRDTATQVWFLDRDSSELADMVIEQPLDGDPELKSMSGRAASEQQRQTYRELHAHLASLAVHQTVTETHRDYEAQ